MTSRVDIKKAVEVLLYVTARTRDMYTALKILYFADKDHLSRHGRLIYGDTYVALQHGPVPSSAYALIEAARGDRWPPPGMTVDDLFRVEENSVIPLRAADARRLSESDRECLDHAIATYGHMSFAQLKMISHDAAYVSANYNDVISLEAIARTLSNGDMVVDYLRHGLD